MMSFFWEAVVFVGGVFGSTIGFVILGLVFLLLVVPFIMMYRDSRSPKRRRSSISERRSAL